MKKIYIVSFILVNLILYQEINSYIEQFINVNNLSFNHFLRNFFHLIFIKNGEYKVLNINKIITLYSFYFLAYMKYIVYIANNMIDFKEIIKYNSNSVKIYYYRSFKYFIKEIIKIQFFVMFNILAVYYLITKDINILNYLIGIVDLLKILFLINLPIIFNIIFKINKAINFIIIYILITSYLFLFNNVSIFYILILYIILFIVNKFIDILKIRGVKEC